MSLLRKSLQKELLKGKPRKRYDDPEYKLHKAICDFIRAQYPKAMFNSGMEGIKLSKAAAGKVRMLRSESGFPDLNIMESRHGYYGLFIEIKIESPFKKDGSLKSNKHLAKQATVIQKLNDRGYKAQFVWSLDMAIGIIREYMLNLHL